MAVTDPAVTGPSVAKSDGGNSGPLLSVRSAQGIVATITELRAATTDRYGPVTRQFEASLELAGESAEPFDINVRVTCAGGISFQTAILNFDNGYGPGLQYQDTLWLLPAGDLTDWTSCVTPASISLSIGDRNSSTPTNEKVAPLSDQVVTDYNSL